MKGKVKSEEAELLKQFGPLLRKAELSGILANNAKIYQDIVNSKALTAGQLAVMNSQSNLNNTNSALGLKNYEFARRKYDVDSKFRLYQSDLDYLIKSKGLFNDTMRTNREMLPFGKWI